MISKWEKLEFPFPPLMTKRSKSNPPQQSAKLNSDNNKNSLTLREERCKQQICIPNSPGASFLLVFACCKQRVQELKIVREGYFSIRTHWSWCARKQQASARLCWRTSAVSGIWDQRGWEMCSRATKPSHNSTCGTLGHQEHWPWWWQWPGSSTTQVSGKTHLAHTGHGHPTPGGPTAACWFFFSPIFSVMWVPGLSFWKCHLYPVQVLGTHRVAAAVPTPWAGMDASSGCLSFLTACTAGIFVWWANQTFPSFRPGISTFLFQIPLFLPQVLAVVAYFIIPPVVLIWFWAGLLHSLSPDKVTALALGSQSPSSSWSCHCSHLPWKDSSTAGSSQRHTWPGIHKETGLAPTFSNQVQGELSPVPSPVEQQLQRVTELYSHHKALFLSFTRRMARNSLFPKEKSECFDNVTYWYKKPRDFCSILR